MRFSSFAPICRGVSRPATTGKGSGEPLPRSASPRSSETSAEGAPSRDADCRTDPDSPPTSEAATMQERQRARLRLILGFVATLGALGCATMGEQGESLVPTRYRTRTGPYAVYSNFPIAADAPAI